MPKRRTSRGRTDLKTIVRNTLPQLPAGAVGYTIGDAWSVAMRPNGSHSVVDLEGGGYAVPLERNKRMAPPSRTVPIRARIPSGEVFILPGRSFGVWKIVKGR